MKPLTFKNIAISGEVATGKGTLMENLKSYLLPLGWSFTSGGKILRDYLNEHVQPNASLASKEFHNQLDDRTIQLFEKGHYVVEAWLAGFMSRDRTDTLRVKLICSSDSVRVDRVVNRDNIDIETAKTFIVERKRDNFESWKKIYGEHDFFDDNYFHLIIDTYSSGPNETVGKVLDKLGYKNGS